MPNLFYFRSCGVEQLIVGASHMDHPKRINEEFVQYPPQGGQGSGPCYSSRGLHVKDKFKLVVNSYRVGVHIKRSLVAKEGPAGGATEWNSINDGKNGVAAIEVLCRNVAFFIYCDATLIFYLIGAVPVKGHDF